MMGSGLGTRRDFWKRHPHHHFAVVLGSVTLLLLMLGIYFVLVFSAGKEINQDALMDWAQPLSKGGRGNHSSLSSPHRKLLLVGRTMAMEEPRRIGEHCNMDYIMISQGPTSPFSEGIPSYTVEITNECLTGCEISGIHLSCGWFSSDRLISPKIFKRLGYNDCLVNDGKALRIGDPLVFVYTSTYPYPLTVSNLTCTLTM